MHKTFSLISGASLGAGLMYFLDADRGRRRRALMRVKGIRWPRKTRRFAGGAAREMQNIQPPMPVTDRTLADRVRSMLGQCSRHPSAIDVHATDGVVTLSGPVLEDEFDSISNAIARIAGVTQIFNRLERHESPYDIPALQEAMPGPQSTLKQSNWSPTARMVAALMGTAALLYGLSQRTAGAATLAASGLGLLVRSASQFNERFENA